LKEFQVLADLLPSRVEIHAVSNHSLEHRSDADPLSDGEINVLDHGVDELLKAGRIFLVKRGRVGYLSVELEGRGSRSNSDRRFYKVCVSVFLG
jgi:hypothetical protein